MISEDTENPTVRLIICETHNKRCQLVSRVIKCPYCNKNVCLCKLYSLSDITKTINDLLLINAYLGTENDD